MTQTITATIQGTLQIADSTTGASPLQDALNLSVSGTNLSKVNQGTFGTSPTSITLPVSPTKFIFIQNLSNSNTLTVTWTPTSGSSNPVCTISAGDFIIVGCTAGISSLSFTASGSGTGVSYSLLG